LLAEKVKEGVWHDSYVEAELAAQGFV